MSAIVTVAGTSGGPTSTFVLADAADVASTAPVDGQALVWDSVTSSWGPEAVAGGSGSGYATIQDEGSALTQRAVLNLIGRNVTAVDNTTRTNVTVQDTPAVHAVGNSGTALTIDVSSTSGPVKTITLTGNCTFTLTAPASGRLWTLDLFLAQDATGSRTVTWPAAVKWSGAAGAPTLSTTANAKDWITLSTPDAGVTWYAAVVGKAWA